jgi:hypothetical protein
MSDNKALGRSGLQAEPIPAPPLTNGSRVSYFPVSLVKLVVMHFCTLGAYQYYWLYENWRLIKEREYSDIRPFWRTFFAVFYCFSLFEKIEGSGKLLHLRQSISSGVLAGGWALFSVLSILPDPYWLLTFLSVVFLVPVQQQINRINGQLVPGHDPNQRFTAWNIAAVAVGGSFLVVALIGVPFSGDGYNSWFTLRSSESLSWKLDSIGSVATGMEQSSLC